MKVGTTFLPMSITVMEKGPEFLFGLDMLRRYQCNIDLKANVLRFAVEPEVALPFLAEHELPESVRFEMQGEAETGGASLSNTSSWPSAISQSKDSNCLHAHYTIFIWIDHLCICGNRFIQCGSPRCILQPSHCAKPMPSPLES